MRKRDTLLGVLGILPGLLFFIIALYWGSTQRAENRACKAACIKAGYVTGEVLPWRKETACECWNRKPGPPVQMVIE